MPQHAASTTCWPILVHFGAGFIGISVGAFIPTESDLLLGLCKIEL